MTSDIFQLVNPYNGAMNNQTIGAPNPVLMENLRDDCTLIYYDASFDGNTNNTGIGINMTTCACIYKVCKIVKCVERNPEEAECLAVLEAIKWAKSKNLTFISLYSDAKKFMDYLKNKNNSLCWFSSTIIDDCYFRIINICYLDFVQC